MIYLVEFYNLPHFFVYKGRTIVAYDSMRYPKSYNYIFFDEIHHSSFNGFVEWYGLHLFSEILCSYKDPYVPIGRWIDWSHQVNSQVWKGHGVTILYKLYGWEWIKKACTWQPWHLFTIVAHLHYAPIQLILLWCSSYSPTYISFSILWAFLGPKHRSGSPSYAFLKRIPSCRK